MGATIGLSVFRTEIERGASLCGARPGIARSHHEGGLPEAGRPQRESLNGDEVRRLKAE
jgi:hypothetical protein